jgi:hypothetical protein
MSSYAASKLADAEIYKYLCYEHPGLFVLNIHPGVIKMTVRDKGLASGLVDFHDDNKFEFVVLSYLPSYWGFIS